MGGCKEDQVRADGVTEKSQSFACSTEQSGSYTEDYGESLADFKEKSF